LRLATVIVLGPLAPCAIVKLLGEAESPKSGGGGGGSVTVSASGVLCVNEPLLPTIDTANDPVAVAPETATVSALVTLPLRRGRALLATSLPLRKLITEMDPSLRFVA
jgi:hypothetical protein